MSNTSHGRRSYAQTGLDSQLTRDNCQLNYLVSTDTPLYHNWRRHSAAKLKGTSTHTSILQAANSPIVKSSILEDACSKYSCVSASTTHYRVCLPRRPKIFAACISSIMTTVEYWIRLYTSNDGRSGVVLLNMVEGNLVSASTAGSRGLPCSESPAVGSSKTRSGHISVPPSTGWLRTWETSGQNDGLGRTPAAGRRPSDSFHLRCSLDRDGPQGYTGC